MADYFTYFSVTIPLTPAQKEYALQLSQQIEAHRSDGQPLPPDFPGELAEQIEDWNFDVESQGDGIWLHSLYGGQEVACVYIQHLLQKFDFAPYVAFQWSDDCSKPLTDAYGGGAAFITATEIKTYHTSEWLRQLTS